MALFGSGDIGMDLGTSVIHIVVKGKGVVFSESACVAFERETRNVIAAGDRAKRMMGRTPRDMDVERPFREPHIRSFDLVNKMVNSFVRNFIKEWKMGRPRLFLALPCGLTPTERQTIIEMMVDAGARTVVPVDESVASAIGAKIRIDQPYGRMNVDMGGARTSIAVFSMGNQAKWRIDDFGGDRLDAAVMDYMRRKHNLIIGENTAERLKIILGAVRPFDQTLQEEVFGRSLISGLPRGLIVNSDEITEALQPPIHDFVNVLHRFIEQTPPELASDIFDAGITLSGGSARLYGMEEMLTEQIGMPFHVADEPELTVARGLAELISNPDAYEKINLGSPYKEDEVID